VLGVAYGQYALNPLLVSELCGYGGRLFGRAFDPSQFVGDSCFEALGELRYDIPVTGVIKDLTQAQLYAFTDHGNLHNIAPVPGTFSNVDAGSVGAGLRLGWLENLNVDLSVAHIVQGRNLTGTSALPGEPFSGQKATRFFVIVSGRL
jgi:hemolysin activation/secretion protein